MPTAKRSIPVRQSTSARGKKFEEATASLLQLFGYEVDRNVIRAGNQIDIIATVDLPTHQDILWVECKAYQNPLTIDEARLFGGVIASAPDSVRGLLVTFSDITGPAKTYILNHPRLDTITYRDLERKVIDPARRLSRIVDSYPRTEIANTYVDLKCIASGDQAVSAETALSADLSSSESSNLFVILGDYGSGKSTLLEHLEYSLASAYLNSSTGRIPILVNLGEYAKALNIRQLITDILVHRLGIRSPRYDLFEDLLRSGRLVLLFDGFDEMSARVDDITVRENFAAIARLASDDARIVLSCRTSFFRSRDEENALLGVPTDSLKDTLAAINNQVPTRIYRILPFTRQQIERVTERYVDFQKGRGRKRLDQQELLNKISSTYNLEELAQRPFLLNMILRSIPHMGTSLRTLSAGALYEIYTNRWVLRDAEKGRTLETPKRRLFFAEEIAFEMYTKGIASLHWREIPDWINRHLGVSDRRVDYYDYDVRACNFLSRTDQGLYSFAHRSFMEFFVARTLLDRLANNGEFGLLASCDISEETRQFMTDLGGNELAGTLHSLLQLVSLNPVGLGNRATRLMAKNVLGLLRQLGFVRVVGDCLTYLWQGADRNVKAYLAHYLEGTLRELSATPEGDIRLLLAASCLCIRWQRKGLDPRRIHRLWRSGARMRSALKWAYSNLPGRPQDQAALAVVGEVLWEERGRLSVPTSELAFAVDMPEDEVVRVLKAHRGI